MTPQEPLGSPFGAASTTSDVVAGIPLGNKVAVVTGGNSGLGLETARTLARAGAHVHVLDRELGTAQVELAPHDADFIRLDLADPESIDAAADLFLRSGRPVHILVNAAGIMAPPLSRDPRGNERQLSTNHLGHFRLTGRLWPALRAERARVVAYSSLGHQFSAVDFDDPNYQRRAYNPMAAYGQSKTANSLFAVELDRRGQEHGVRAFAVHPGNVASTGLGRFLAHDDMVAAGLIEPHGTPIVDPERRLKTPEQGAATGVWCATSPRLEGMGGVYCEDCDIARMSSEEGPLDFFKAGDGRGVMGYAVDPGQAERLWDLSENLTGLRYP
ncbi:SDR family NAD(P)-dependent oxidoreductase [Actinomadura bangladeshensis]|uniref:SDR family NAD(P)-dependent oxidoreductase n=1 Tax=Actinomadura bangladeshensis TaxID=453573 RepID=UPI001FB57794|nr:SDR family NAD(P)-dependent oxidoreductase [Actinomadura bangladeshensis]